MRVLVLSDSHRRVSLLEQAILAQPEARHLIFLGDGEEDMEQASLLCNSLSGSYRIFKVRGNCDWYSALPEELLETLAQRRVFMTHGHGYMVKSSDEALLQAAKDAGASIALYGHTHVPVHAFTQGIHLFNPGSIANGSYGAIDFLPEGAAFLHMQL